MDQLVDTHKLAGSASMHTTFCSRVGPAMRRRGTGIRLPTMYAGCALTTCAARFFCLVGERGGSFVVTARYSI